MIYRACRQWAIINLLVAVVVGGIGCNGIDTKITYLDPENAPKPGDKNWIALFNGKDFTGWIQKQRNVPMSWKVVDGVMVNTALHGHPGTDIYTERKFDDFEIYYEYRIPPGSNSGVYLRGCYEIQILDSFGDKRKQNSKHINGAIYGLLAVPQSVSRKAGEWQTVYAKLAGKKLTVVLNGYQVFDNVELTRITPGGLGKDYSKSGPILIQGNHGSVDFRTMMIRPIKCTAGNQT
ncbi:MAG: DUF1080 domain-containing protein [Planctomycetota bacterium]|nr:MAG: DUF1080 domain-containing protein [Planctomycetota bacterium]